MKYGFRHTMMSVVLTLVFMLVVGCKTDSPITPASLVVTNFSISGNLLNGTEGRTNTTYIFTLRHDPIGFPAEYHWDFDDTSNVIIRRGTNNAQYSFNRTGFYTVLCRVIHAETKLIKAEAKVTVNIRDSLPNISMKLIPAGIFTMGSTREFYERPQRQVTITRPFFMGTYELLQSEWRVIMGTAPSWHDGRDSLPLETVSWYDAIDFCNRLSVRSGFTPCYSIRGDTIQCFFSANGYRLPTEAEWEYAARAGVNDRDYYCGIVEQPFASCTESDTLDSDLASIAWYCFNSEDRVHPVGKKLPNKFGLYDMLGNVSELVWDYFSSDAYSTLPATNPTGPEVGSRRMIRGGAFNNGAFDVRANSRRQQAAQFTKDFVTGFRVVRTP